MKNGLQTPSQLTHPDLLLQHCVHKRFQPVLEIWFQGTLKCRVFRCSAPQMQADVRIDRGGSKPGGSVFGSTIRERFLTADSLPVASSVIPAGFLGVQLRSRIVDVLTCVYCSGRWKTSLWTGRFGLFSIPFSTADDVVFVRMSDRMYVGEIDGTPRPNRSAVLWYTIHQSFGVLRTSAVVLPDGAKRFCQARCDFSISALLLLWLG